MKYGLGKRILETNRLPWNSDHHLDPEFRIPTDNRARKLDELQMHKKLSLSSVNLPRHLERVVPTIGPGSRMEPIFEQEEDLKVMEKPDGDDKELKTEQEANIDVTMNKKQYLVMNNIFIEGTIKHNHHIFLRIQFKLNTALLSHCPSVRPCVRVSQA